MKSNPNKSVEKFIEQAEKMLKADAQARQDGSKHSLVSTMRGVLHTRVSQLKVKTTKLDEINEKLAELVIEKKVVLKKTRDALQNLQVYVENAYFFDAKENLAKLAMSEKAPLDELGLLEYTKDVMQGIKTAVLPMPIPIEYSLPVGQSLKPLHQIVIEAERLRQEKAKAVEIRLKALDELRDVFPTIRKWLWKMLPNGREDKKLIDYGFKPYGK